MPTTYHVHCPNCGCGTSSSSSGGSEDSSGSSGSGSGSGSGSSGGSGGSGSDSSSSELPPPYCIRCGNCCHEQGAAALLTPRYAFPPSDDPWVQALRDAWQAWEGGLVYNTDHYLGVQEFVYTFLFEDWVYNEETGEDEWVSEWVESRYRLVIRMGCGTYSPGSGGGQVYVDVEVSPGSWENIGIWISILAGFEPRTCCRWHFAYIYDGSYIETPTELLVTHNRCCLNEEMTECVVCENPCTHSSSSEE